MTLLKVVLVFREMFIIITSKGSRPNIPKTASIDQFRYINDLNKRCQNEALGNKPHKLCNYSPEPRTEVYCVGLFR